MTRIIALFVVLTLAGAPVANAMCVGWCGSGQAVVTGHCDDDAAAATSPTITGTNGVCSGLLLVRPFLKQDGHAALALDLPTSAVRVDAKPVAQVLASPARAANEPRAAIRLVLRL